MMITKIDAWFETTSPVRAPYTAASVTFARSQG